jgi:hypothetical protein
MENNTRKSEEYRFDNHTYTIEHNPDAPDGRRWTWVVAHIIALSFVGEAATMAAAHHDARHTIKELGNDANRYTDQSRNNQSTERR